MKNIIFYTTMNTKFGIGIQSKKTPLGKTPEGTFKNCLKRLPKSINWTMIEFEQDGRQYLIEREKFNECLENGLLFSDIASIH